MTEQTLLTIKDLFYRVKQFYYGTSEKTLSAAALTSGDAAEYIAALKDAARAVEEEGGSLPTDARAMLLAAVGYTKDAFLDKDFRKAGALAELGIQLCGVYSFPFLSRKRFFKLHLTPLREEYGEELFAEWEDAFLSAPDTRICLRPRFRRPKNDVHYYEEDSDGEMQRAHPALYTLFAILGGVLFVGAIALYLVLTTLLGLSGAWIFLGVFGAAACGMAFFSLLMSFIHQYFGHIPTAILLLFGVASVIVSVILL